jgi:hypothetical protein
MLMCIGITFITFSQTNTDSIPVIPKKASIIYVQPVNFDSIISELQKQNFKIDNMVHNSKIVTRYKMYGDLLRQISLHIRYSDSTAQIMATIYRSGRAGEREDYPVTSSSKKAFAVMNNFALSLKGRIRYEK